MKKILVLVAVLAVSTIACQAFNDSYGEDGVVPAGVEETQTQGGGGEPIALGDFSADTTECVAIEGVKVVKAEKSGDVKVTVLSVAEEGAVVLTVAEQIGVYTTKVSILNGEEEALSFTVKQTDKDKFDVCNVVYKGMDVKSGEVTIDTFNTEKVNAGTFKFEFAAPSAVKTMTALIKAAAEAEEATVVEGSYFTNETVDKMTKVAEEKKE